MAQTHHLSPAAYDRLKREYDDLTTRGRVEIARKIEAARELGDLSEAGAGGGAVSHGSVVSIRYEGDDEVERYLVGSIEERHDDLDVISPSSPLGEALLGSGRGDTVSFTAPTGAELRVEVVAVD
jgi:transcription elongation factor GreA